MVFPGMGLGTLAGEYPEQFSMEERAGGIFPVWHIIKIIVINLSILGKNCVIFLHRHNLPYENAVCGTDFLVWGYNALVFALILIIIINHNHVIIQLKVSAI